MGLPQSQAIFDAEAYLAWEAEQPERSEYIGGEVFAMVGVRREHATVTLNLGTLLRQHLRGSPCLAFVADMKLRVEQADAFFYPDAMVTCDAHDRRAELFVEHPKLIVEILSDSTAAFDRGAKFAAYRKLAALEEYVLVDIAVRRVEVFRRQPGEEWLLHDYGGEAAFPLDSVGLTLTMEQVFEDVETAPGETLAEYDHAAGIPLLRDCAEALRRSGGPRVAVAEAVAAVRPPHVGGVGGRDAAQGEVRHQDVMVPEQRHGGGAVELDARRSAGVYRLQGGRQRVRFEEGRVEYLEVARAVPETQIAVAAQVDVGRAAGIGDRLHHHPRQDRVGDPVSVRPP